MTKQKETERQKMLSGKPHLNTDPELVRLRTNCRKLLTLYNASQEEPLSDQRKQALADLLNTEARDDLIIQAPFYCDYGVHIHIGKNFLANFDCVILDCANVYIGDNVMLAPKVQIYAVGHPLDPIERGKPTDIAKEVRIGNNVWIGGGSIVLPGVTIGDNAVIGAGSVVARDIPANTVAVGNPCRVIRQLNPEEFGKGVI